MGSLQKIVDDVRPLDEVFGELRESNEILLYLTPMPAARIHDPLNLQGLGLTAEG